jgi:hypothetical protein
VLEIFERTDHNLNIVARRTLFDEIEENTPEEDEESQERQSPCSSRLTRQRPMQGMLKSKGRNRSDFLFFEPILSLISSLSSQHLKFSKILDSTKNFITILWTGQRFRFRNKSGFSKIFLDEMEIG